MSLQSIALSPIKRGHHAISDGAIPICTTTIPTGGCTCCSFGTGNWIGLLPGEMEVLSSGDTTGWADVPGGITCSRNPATCDNKPLDCKMYPFFPYKSEDRGDHWFVSLGAGDQKCAARQSLITSLKGKVFSTPPDSPFGDHLFSVARIGVALHEAGLSEWMSSTYSGYVGYSSDYFVIIKKG